MKDAQILVVEDEFVVAEDLLDILSRFGYEIAGVASSAREAMRKAADAHPGLVLMDIMLGGTFDGVVAAEHMWTILNIPVVYLTAYTDETTLERAMHAEPFGYLMKPFNEKELHTTIQVALYKHEMERKRKEREGQWASTLSSEVVIATDTEGRVTFMNPVAEALTGWREEQALGTYVEEVFKIKAGSTPGLESLNAIPKKETQRPIAHNIAPIRDGRGSILGGVVVFADGTKRMGADKERAKLILRLQDELARAEALSGQFPICVFCKKIRDARRYWHRIEAYFQARYNAAFTHSICPGCAKEKYPAVFSDHE